MPGVAPIFPVFLTLAAKEVGAGLIAQTLIFAASTAAVQNVMPSPTTPPIARGLEIQKNSCSLNCSLPLIYGQVRMSGNDVFYHTHGEAPLFQNKYLWIVENYGEGECEGIAENDDSNPKKLIFINDELLAGSQYEDLVEYTFYNGTADQTYDEDLHAVCPEWTFNKRRTCYMVWKFTYNIQKFPSIPRRQVVLKGRKVWLPDGTKAYSNNAAAVLYDFLRSPHYAAALGYPGEDMLLSDEIDFYSYLAAYNYCQPNSDFLGWEYNGLVSSGERIGDVIDRIRKHFRGVLQPSPDGMLYFKYKDLNEEAVCMNLTDDHIARDERGKAMIGITPTGLVNNADGMWVNFVNPKDDRYYEDTVKIGETEGDIRPVDLPGYNSKEMAGAMGSYLLERTRDPYDRIISGVFRDDCQQLEKNDIVTLTCTALGYSAQYMRVIKTTRHSSGLVTLEMQLEHTDLYNDEYDVATETSFECTLPDPANFDPVTQPERYVELAEEDFNSASEYQLGLSDLNKVYVIDSNNDLTVLMPSVGSDQLGARIKFKHYGTGKLYVTAADSDTIDTSSAGGHIFHEQSGISQEGSITIQLATSTHWAVDSILGPWFTDAADELFLHTALYINDKTFGNQGVQIQYNSGLSQIYCGDGADAFIKFDGTKPTWKGANTELDATGNLTCTGGAIGGWTLAATTLSSANITIDSGNDRILCNTITIDGANDRIRSSNYVSGSAGAGFTVEPDLIEAGNFAARGIFRTAVFQKDVVSAIGGNVVITKGSDVLATDMTAADGSTLTIEGNETFSLYDFLRIKDDTDDEWFYINSVASAPTYGVLRDRGLDYPANGNPAWKKGATVVNYGQSGQGLIHLTASETNAPFISVYTHAGVPWTTLTTRLRIGNLNGYLGYSSDIYGIGIGDTDNYIKYDPTNGIQIQVNAANAITIKSGGDIKLESSATNPGLVKLTGSSYGVEIGNYAADGSVVRFAPDTDNEVSLYIGTDNYMFDEIRIYSKTLNFYDYIDASNNVQIHTYVEGSDGDSQIMFDLDSDTSARITLHHDGTAGEKQIILSSHKDWNLADASHAFDDAYADDWNNVADFPHLDIKDDLQAICNIKGSGIIDKRTGLELINDKTLPEWLLTKHKKTGEILYDADGKPYIPLKAAISLAWGAIRQLRDEIDDLKIKHSDFDSKAPK